MLEVALPHWRTFPACLVSPIAASSGRRATLKRLSVQCDLQQLFIRFGRIIHAGTACSFTMPRAASRSATLNRFSRKSRRSSPGGSCGKAALFGIGSMPLLNPPGMLLRPDAEVLKKPTSICIPMPRSRSLEPVVLGFEQLPKQSPPQEHMRLPVRQNPTPTRGADLRCPSLNSIREAKPAQLTEVVPSVTLVTCNPYR